jgi:hypothetical protein
MKSPFLKLKITDLSKDTLQKEKRNAAEKSTAFLFYNYEEILLHPLSWDGGMRRLTFTPTHISTY